MPGVSTGPDPLDVLKEYYGKSVLNFDDWLNNRRYMNFNNPTEAATGVLKEIELIPQFAEGGLADVLQVRSGYAQGIGPVGPGRRFEINTKMPVIDPYKLFFRYQNKLMFDNEKKRRGLARILEV